jgi:hypothetical protein
MISRHLLKLLHEDEAIVNINREALGRKQLPVYSLYQASREELFAESRRWAEVLCTAHEGYHGRVEETAYQDRLVLRHADGRRIRSYFASGCVEYRNLQRAYTGSTSVDNLQSAAEIAEQFLGRFALWPFDSIDQLRVNDLSFLSSQGMHSTGRLSPVTLTNAILRYRRITRDVAWIGPGAFLECIIEGTSVVGYTRNWRPTMRVAEPDVELMALDQALQHCSDAYLHPLFTEYERAENLRIKQVEFGYYAADRWTTQQFLLPAYRISLSIRGQVAAAVTQIIPAHKDRRMIALLPVPEKQFRHRSPLVRKPAPADYPE